MISGLLTLLLLATSPGADSAAVLEDLVERIAARAGPERLAFTEQRESDLLDEPLTVRGRLWRDEQGRLIRRTETPREETQILDARSLTIRRPGQRDRHFSLGRAPELAVLHRALSALLDGDVEALREHFSTRLEGDDSAWRLRLEPSDEELAEAVVALELSGHAARIREMVLELSDSSRIVTELHAQP